jgi:hypothetical protein
MGIEKGPQHPDVIGLPDKGQGHEFDSCSQVFLVPGSERRKLYMDAGQIAMPLRFQPPGREDFAADHALAPRDNLHAQ